MAWREYKFGELTENLDARRKPVKEVERVTGPFPYYGASGIVDHVDDFLFDGLHLLIAEDGENLRTRRLPIAFLADGRFWVNNHAHIVRGNKRADTKFLLYALSVSDFSSYLSGSTMPKLTQGNLNRIPIHAPDLPEQQAIASVLSALDDKIELNRRMNETLEAQARALFRDWFVDFGPVRRKLAGATDPVAIMGGLTSNFARPAELRGLFPDALGDDDLPVGWHLKRVDDFMELAYGKSLPKTARRPGNVPVYGSGGIGGYHDEPLNAGPAIIVGRKGTVGSLFWEPSQFFAIDTVFYVVPKTGVSLHFIWQLLQTLGLTEMNTDAAVPGLNRSNVYRLEVPAASAGVLHAFDEVTGPLRAMMDARNLENQTLAQTRDLLLPKLMSGEIRVEATKATSEHLS